LPHLKKLDLSTNKLAEVSGLPELPSLEHLDLSNNKIASKDFFRLLADYTKLKVLIMVGTPVAEELADRFKAEVLVSVGIELRDLKTLNEEEVVEEDYQGAEAERNERAKAKREAEEEAARLAAEKAAEEAAAAAAGQEPKQEE